MRPPGASAAGAAQLGRGPAPGSCFQLLRWGIEETAQAGAAQVWLQAQDKHMTLWSLVESPSLQSAAATLDGMLQEELAAVETLDHSWKALMAAAAAAPNMVEASADGSRASQVGGRGRTERAHSSVMSQCTPGNHHGACFAEER